MRFLLVFIIFISVYSLAQKNAYIDNIEDDDAKISVFTLPGQSWNFCPGQKKDCKPAIGWLDRDSSIEVIGDAVIKKIINPETLLPSEDSFTKVKFKYSRKGEDGKTYNQSGEGYIPSEYISDTKRSSVFAISENLKTYNIKQSSGICLKNDTSKLSFSEIKKTIGPLVKPIENLSVIQKADQLINKVGFCPLKPPDKFILSKVDKTKNVYDSLIKSEIKKTAVPDILNENGKKMTSSNLIEIDALARTLYGEMAICYRNGLQYPMAVAKIILNRAKNTQRHKEFIKPPQDTDKPDIAKVCTTPSQFSMWFKNVNGEPNAPLHHGLCPPQQENKPYWNGKKAAKYESDVWKNSVRIATEAILHPKQFNRRTASVDGYFYTSGMGSFLGMSQMTGVSIEGRPLSSNKCLELWKEKTSKK